MKYSLEQKAQLMALQYPGRTFVCEFDEYVLLTDGHMGYYIKKSDLMINIDKLKKPTTINNDLAPETLIKSTTKANKTRNIHLTPNGKMAIKLKSEDGKKAWVNMDFLKLFGDYVQYRISSEKEPVLISDYKGIPLGIVLPMKINDEEVEG